MQDPARAAHQASLAPAIDALRRASPCEEIAQVKISKSRLQRAAGELASRRSLLRRRRLHLGEYSAIAGATRDYHDTEL